MENPEPQIAQISTDAGTFNAAGPPSFEAAKRRMENPEPQIAQISTDAGTFNAAANSEPRTAHCH